MKHYLKELNTITENIILNKGEGLDGLYKKIIEGKEQGYEFMKIELSVNHIDQDKISIKNKTLFEHYSYLINLRNEDHGNNTGFFTNVEDDIKRNLRKIYSEERDEDYFGIVENKNAIYYIFTDSVIDFVIDKALHYHVESLLYHQKITAKNFIQVWVEFFKSEDPLNSYDINKDYTKKMIGYFNADINHNENSKLLIYIRDKMGPTLNIYTQDRYSDVSFYSDHAFQGVMSLQYDKKQREDNLKKIDYKWWSQCMISLEHENDYLMCYEEMIYLTTRRARLKVLVTYFDDYNIEGTRTVLEALCENFSTIIRQSNLLFNENEQTEYLLIVGSRLKEDNKQKRFIWNMQAFNWSGQWTEKYSQL